MHLGEYCYNTTYHMSIGMAPFKVLYGYKPLSFMDRVWVIAVHLGKRIGFNKGKTF